MRNAHAETTGDRASPLLAVGGERRGAKEGSMLLALLVTDLKGFTPLVEQLGDERAREMMQLHDRLVRGPIADLGGHEVAHTGDGIMAAFGSVRAALTAACRIQQDLTASGEDPSGIALRARVGVHAGEPLPMEGRLIGRCVNTAVRVCQAAEAERILVTDLARVLSGDRSFCFGNSRALRLKGLSSEVTVQELLWRKPPVAGELVSRKSGRAQLRSL